MPFQPHSPDFQQQKQQQDERVQRITNMQPTFLTTRGQGQFMSMPAEIFTGIFCLLPSFADVFALATTCTRSRHIWTTNVNTIYSMVAKRSILCERHARRFLAEQMGLPSGGSTLSTGDVVRIVRNARVVEHAIVQFEREIVCRVQCFSARKYYGAKACKHPPYLTRTERPRFIRTYYRLWGMMKVGAAEWQSRLEALTMKQLYHLYEMTRLTQRIEGEDLILKPLFPNADPSSFHAISLDQSQERIVLGKKTWEHIEQTYQRIHHKEAEWPWDLAKDEGFLWFIVLWDHWQESLKQIVCDRQATQPSTRPLFEQQYLWDDSSEEEVMNEDLDGQP